MNQQELEAELHDIFEFDMLKLSVGRFDDTIRQVAGVFLLKQERLIKDIESKMPGRNISIDDSSLDRDLDEYERGWNDVVDQVRVILEGLRGSSQDKATPKAQGHEADNLSAGVK